MSLDFYLCVCVRVWMCWCKWKFKLVTHLLLKREVSGHPVQHHHLPPEQRPALKLPCLMHSFTCRRLTKIVQDKGPPWRHRTHSTCPLLFFYGSVIGMKGISEIVLFFFLFIFFWGKLSSCCSHPSLETRNMADLQARSPKKMKPTVTAVIGIMGGWVLRTDIARSHYLFNRLFLQKREHIGVINHNIWNTKQFATLL